MASIVSKLARAAAVASRACPAPAVVGCSSRPMAPRLYLAGRRRICSGVSPARNTLERDDPKPSSVAAAAVMTERPSKNTPEKDGPDSPPPPKSSGGVFVTIGHNPNFPRVHARSLESKEALWALYEYWFEFHGKQRSRAEMKRRFRRFRITAEFVDRANNSGGSVKHGLTQFADMSPDEMPRNRVMSRRTSYAWLSGRN